MGQVTLPKVTGAVAVSTVALATFWSDHQDAVIVFIGFVLLTFIAVLLLERLDRRNIAFQEQQVRTLRSHIARFYTIQRRKNRAFEHRLTGLEHITRSVDAIDKNCAARSARNDALRTSIGALNENQHNLRDHFHDRLEKIEYKLTLAHEKAITKLTLKGVLKDDP